MSDEKVALKLNKKLGHTVPLRQLFDILDLINDYFYEKIISNEPIYIDKFGTITQMVPKSRRIWSRFKNQYVMTKPTPKLVFRPHVVFTRLIKLRRKKLEVPGKFRANP